MTRSPWLVGQANTLTEAIRRHLASRSLGALRVCVAACFLGRAWQHLRWDAPFRALLWDQQLMERPVRLLLGMSWEEYSVPQVDQLIQLGIKAWGVFYLICGIVSLVARPGRRWQGVVLVLGAAGLFSLSLLYWKDHFQRFADLVEHTAQWAGPLLLAAVLNGWGSDRWIRLAAKLAIAGTFMGHGLYAVGYYEGPPGEFLTMVINVFGCGEQQAAELLRIAGILDLIICVGIFLPRVRKVFLLYAAAWGLLTALARVWANFSPDFPLATIDQYLFQTLVRLPHVGLPLFLLLDRGIQTAATRSPELPTVEGNA